IIQKLKTKLYRLGQSSSRALGSSAATELSGSWGTLRSRARRVMAMAMTASLKEMVRPVSIPPPFESSCGALMQVSFGRPSSHTTKKRDRVRRDASIHLIIEKGFFPETRFPPNTILGNWCGYMPRRLFTVIVNKGG